MRVIRLLALMLLTLLQACAPSPPSAEPPHAYWAEAGVLYVASGAPGNVRVMYARGGGITLVGDVAVAPGRAIRALRVDSAHRVLWAYTDEEALELDLVALSQSDAARHPGRVVVTPQKREVAQARMTNTLR